MARHGPCSRLICACTRRCRGGWLAAYRALDFALGCRGVRRASWRLQGPRHAAALPSVAAPAASSAGGAADAHASRQPGAGHPAHRAKASPSGRR
jgi:hypothetical protein